MRIPANSTFTKEISKQFKQIFHRDMTLGGLQDLQEQLDLIDSVDTHLVNQVSKLNKGNGHEPTTQKMFQVQERLDKTIIKEQDLLTRLSKLKQKKKNLQFKMHMMKYHQPVL